MIWFKKKPPAETESQSEYIEDLFPRYLEAQFNSTSYQKIRELRRYWRSGAVLNLISLGFMVTSTVICLSRNAEIEINLIRVDGGQVKEVHDLRRKVMIKNTIDRMRIKQNLKKENDAKKG
ncbi:hypothetical protein [Alteromonas sp. 14N.309.X.WAT.G.H12]|uniref:hypothetical protein n=1 Tax=Alteromonas sp. 14N.309.X.WAT.G.H12 TaxID=3120824 RepID=UPI002FD28532